MSHVVYEEEYLGNFPKPETFSEADLPLALPTSAVSHQGLCLSTDGDQLVGRAENGMKCCSMYPTSCSVALLRWCRPQYMGAVQDQQCTKK